MSNNFQVQESKWIKKVQGPMWTYLLSSDAKSYIIPLNNTSNFGFGYLKQLHLTKEFFNNRRTKLHKIMTETQIEFSMGMKIIIWDEIKWWKKDLKRYPFNKKHQFHSKCSLSTAFSTDYFKYENPKAVYICLLG